MTNSRNNFKRFLFHKNEPARFSIFAQTFAITSQNRPFLSCKNSHFKKKAYCKTFPAKMTCICSKINKRFVINGLPLIASLWHRALGQLGNKRLSILVLLLVVNNRCIYFFRRRYNSFRKLSRVWSWCHWNWIKSTPTFWTIRLVCFPKSFSGPKSPWRRYIFYLILSIADLGNFTVVLSISTRPFFSFRRFQPCGQMQRILHWSRWDPGLRICCSDACLST